MRCADSYVVAVVVLRRCGIEYVGVCENDEDKFATESSTTEARSLKPAESWEIDDANVSAVIAAVSDEVEEEERLSNGVVRAVKDEETLERPAEDDESIDDNCASVWSELIWANEEDVEDNVDERSVRGVESDPREL